MAVKYTLSKKSLVDSIEVEPIHKGQCHCGAVKFTVHLDQGLIDPRRCNCSMCRRRGAVVASVELKDLVVDEGEDVLGFINLIPIQRSIIFVLSAVFTPIIKDDQIQNYSHLI